MNIHILGICGTLMGSIALLAKQLGHTVTGSDENVYPPMSTQLESAGIALSTGYQPDHFPADTDLVIVGNANLPRGNPALEHVLRTGVDYTSGAEWLGRHLLADRWVIAVAGTHGKTTTTSMTAWILESAGLAPGFLVGGVPANFTESARLGETDFFVIEADEYDTSYFDRRSKFLHYRPQTTIIGNLEYDHADIFDSLEDIKQQFHLLIRTVPDNGQIIAPAQDDNVDDVLDRGCWSDVVRFGLQDGEVQARNISADDSEFEVTVNGQTVGQVRWAMAGRHNILNALAAIAASRHVGVAPGAACKALCEFSGVKRRMEVIYQNAHTTVYDDFAHHPTAIRSTLEGLRRKARQQRILAIIEPRSHTMRGGFHHQETLNDATQAADDVIWSQPTDIQWDMTRLSGRVVSDTQQIITAALDAIEHGTTHVVIMSNGGFDNLHRRLVEKLQSRN